MSVLNKIIFKMENKIKYFAIATSKHQQQRSYFQKKSVSYNGVCNHVFKFIYHTRSGLINVRLQTNIQYTYL